MTRASVVERPVPLHMELSSQMIVGGLAAAALDTLYMELGHATHVAVDLGDGHASVHVERLLRPRADVVIRVGQYFEGGSRRGGHFLIAAPEMVFVRTQAGWSPVSLRNDFLGGAPARGEESDLVELVQRDLVDFANAWLGNIQERLVMAARRAA